MNLKSTMTRLHLTSDHLAELCGVNRVQVWRWCAGKASIPQYVRTILALIEGKRYQEILPTTERRRRAQQESKPAKSRAIAKSRNEALFEQ